MVVMVTPVAFNNIGWRTYIIFAVFNAAAIPVMYWCYPETKDRSLEEMDLIFRNTKNLHQAVKLSLTMEKHYDRKGNLVRSVTHDIEGGDGFAHIGNEKSIHHVDEVETVMDVEHVEARE
jgi:hypothetical protein